MTESAQAKNIIAGASDYDVAVVGASLAGCATAMMLARSGARVALVEQRPDTDAFKRVCSHYIQSSAVPTLERMGLLEPMEQAGAVRSRGRIWTKSGWVVPPADSLLPPGVNLRRALMDPLVRRIAADTPGVELMLGYAANELLREGDVVCGMRARSPRGDTLTLRTRLVVGADGRDSRIAKLSGVKEKRVRHGRFAYGGYFDGPTPAHAPDASLWLLDPHMAACFPTDSGQVFYAAMPTKDLLDQFRADPTKALMEFVGAVPDAPPILASRPAEPPQGKIDMTNVAHVPSAPGLALVGDAALAIDPLWGVGCGWAFQQAEWLSDSVTPALQGSESLEAGLKRYRRRHALRLGGHARMMYTYAGGRKVSPPEQMLFTAAAHDEKLAKSFEAFGTRTIGPARMFSTMVPRALMVSTRRSLGRRVRPGSGGVKAESV